VWLRTGPELIRSENHVGDGGFWYPAERERSRVGVEVAWLLAMESGGGLDGDSIPECFELANVGSFLAFGVDALVVEV